MQNENPGVQACHYAFSVLETKRLPLLFSWKTWNPSSGVVVCLRRKTQFRLFS